MGKAHLFPELKTQEEIDAEERTLIQRLCFSLRSFWFVPNWLGHSKTEL